MEDSVKKMFNLSTGKTNKFQEKGYVPQELVEQILVKLPIKSLLRFRSVSKKWELLINNLDSYRNRSFFLVGRSTRENGYIFWVDNEGTFQEYARYEPPSEKEFTFNSCGNGLICFLDNESVVLWNPATGTSLLLPESHVNALHGQRHVFRIVVDNSTNEYKIIKTNCSGNDTSMEIYRQRTRLWELIVGFPHVCAVHACQVDMKGISYWIAFNFDGDHGPAPILVSFDGRAELFKSIDINVPVPDMADHDTFWFYCKTYLFLFQEQELKVVNDEESSLVFIHSVEIGDDPDDEDNEQYPFTYKVWKMQVSDEGKSWNLWSKISFNRRVEPIGFRNNGEFLWARGMMYVAISLGNGFTRKFISMNYSEFPIDESYLSHPICSFPNYVESNGLLQVPENNGNLPHSAAENNVDLSHSAAENNGDLPHSA